MNLPKLEIVPFDHKPEEVNWSYIRENAGVYEDIGGVGNNYDLRLVSNGKGAIYSYNTSRNTLNQLPESVYGNWDRPGYHKFIKSGDTVNLSALDRKFNLELIPGRPKNICNGINSLECGTVVRWVKLAHYGLCLVQYGDTTHNALVQLDNPANTWYTVASHMEFEIVGTLKVTT